MVRSADVDPRWVDAILDWRWTWFLARLGLTGAYILGGVVKAFDFPAAVAEQEHFGLHPGWLWASIAIAIELIGPILVIPGRYAWLGAGALGALTAIATYVANDFWNMEGAARFTAVNAFFEHIGLIAGFVLAALIAEHDNRRLQVSYTPSSTKAGDR
jgi:uncharacterized membrane protein YphA (DoxX/SURF4 family)